MNIDLSYLEDITGGDKEMIIEMLDLFIEDIPKQVTLVKELAEKQDLEMLARETHKLKPTLQYVGLFEIYEVIKELELLSKSGEFSPAINPSAIKAYTLCKEALPSLIKKRDELINL